MEPPTEIQPSGIKPRVYYPELDGLRAIAALLVLTFHLSYFHLLPTGRFIMIGQTGVDLFFVLSGFLITGILMRIAPGDWTAIRNFYGKRSLRIFPLYYLFLALWVLLFRNPLSGWYWVYLQNVRNLGHSMPGRVTSGL